MANKNQEIIEKVQSKLELHFIGDAEGSAERLFNEFARKHASKFQGEFWIAENTDNKLEYTAVHKEYTEMFESSVEKVITGCEVQVQDFY